jgi:hypothetical protein
MDARLLKFLGGDKSLYPEALDAQFPRVFNKLRPARHAAP